MEKPFYVNTYNSKGELWNSNKFESLDAAQACHERMIEFYSNDFVPDSCRRISDTELEITFQNGSKRYSRIEESGDAMMSFHSSWVCALAHFASEEEVENWANDIYELAIFTHLQGDEKKLLDFAETWTKDEVFRVGFIRDALELLNPKKLS